MYKLHGINSRLQIADYQYNFDFYSWRFFGIVLDLFSQFFFAGGILELFWII